MNKENKVLKTAIAIIAIIFVVAVGTIIAVAMKKKSVDNVETNGSETQQDQDVAADDAPVVNASDEDAFGVTMEYTDEGLQDTFDEMLKFTSELYDLYPVTELETITDEYKYSFALETLYHDSERGVSYESIEYEAAEYSYCCFAYDEKDVNAVVEEYFGEVSTPVTEALQKPDEGYCYSQEAGKAQRMAGDFGMDIHRYQIESVEKTDDATPTYKVRVKYSLFLMGAAVDDGADTDAEAANPDSIYNNELADAVYTFTQDDSAPHGFYITDVTFGLTP